MPGTGTHPGTRWMWQVLQDYKEMIQQCVLKQRQEASHMQAEHLLKCRVRPQVWLVGQHCDQAFS